VDLSWASSQLEGNTYSRLDTERLIEYGQAAEGKDALETQMILNHKDTIEFLVRHPDHANLTTDVIISLHAFLSDSLMADPLSCGRIRNRAVEIGGSVYLPVALPQRIEELFGIVIEMAAEIHDPFEQSFFLMVHLPYLQPFEDVNKRVSRLAANIPFIRHNLCPLSFIDVPQQAYVDAMLGVYELNRIELLRDVFVWAYERSCQQYVAVKQNLVPPDIFRLRYRQALSEVVAAIVRHNEPATVEVVRQRTPIAVKKEDQEHFIELVHGEFKTLHRGNVIRFGIRPLEFSAWHEKHNNQS
jgi:Fic family protein